MVVSRPLVLSLIFCLALAAPAQALYEDLSFTVLIEDPQDHVGFLDIREVAVAETGADELVVRYTYADTVPPHAALSFDFFFTAAGTSWSTGITGGGTGTGNGNFAVPDVKSCAIDGGLGYCTLAYDAFDAAVGEALTGTYAITYAGAIQDFGPGVGGASANLLGSRGADYTLTGCTKADATACSAGTGGPAVTYGNLSTPRLLQSFANATSGTYIYNFTNEIVAGQFSYAVNGTGNVTLRLVDGNATELLNRSLSGNGLFNFTGAVAGNWSYELVFANFTGTVGLDLSPPPAKASSSSTSSSSSRTTSSSGSSSSSSSSTAASDAADEEETPAPGFALATLALVGLAVVVRSLRRK